MFIFEGWFEMNGFVRVTEGLDENWFVFTHALSSGSNDNFVTNLPIRNCERQRHLETKDVDIV